MPLNDNQLPCGIPSFATTTTWAYLVGYVKRLEGAAGLMRSSLMNCGMYSAVDKTNQVISHLTASRPVNSCRFLNEFPSHRRDRPPGPVLRRRLNITVSLPVRLDWIIPGGPRVARTTTRVCKGGSQRMTSQTGFPNVDQTRRPAATAKSSSSATRRISPPRVVIDLMRRRRRRPFR